MEEQNNHSVELFKALGDETRLSILRILLEGESYGELIASRLNLTNATVSHHLKKLEEVGLVESRRTQFYRLYSVVQEPLKASLVSLIGTLPPPDDDTRYREQVIASFFENGRLTQLPSQRKKREVVLRFLLEGFEAGQVYTERAFSERLAEAFGDYCLLRREMLAFGLIERSRAPDGGADLYRVL